MTGTLTVYCELCDAKFKIHVCPDCGAQCRDCEINVLEEHKKESHVGTS